MKQAIPLLKHDECCLGKTKGGKEGCGVGKMKKNKIQIYIIQSRRVENGYLQCEIFWHVRMSKIHLEPNNYNLVVYFVNKLHNGIVVSSQLRMGTVSYSFGLFCRVLHNSHVQLIS